MNNKRRGPTYSTEEVDHLLQSLREHLPIGPEEWDLVASEHVKTWGQNGRDTTSLRRKFNQLVKQKMATGDPHCPPHVREAKRIMIGIRQKAELDTCEVEDDGLSLEEVGLCEVEATAPLASVSITKTSTTESSASKTSTTESSASESVKSYKSENISPKLKRIATPRKKSNEEMSITDFMKFSIMQREQDRKDMELEIREERQRREEIERKREEDDRLFKNMFFATMLQNNNVQNGEIMKKF